GGVQVAEGDAAADFVAYSWDADQLFGSAEQMQMSAASQFDDLVGRYLEKTKARCMGDFAAVPVLSEKSGTLRVSSYEIACVSGRGGASASLVFYNDGKRFTAIAHETGLDN